MSKLDGSILAHLATGEAPELAFLAGSDIRPAISILMPLEPAGFWVPYLQQNNCGEKASVAIASESGLQLILFWSWWIRQKFTCMALCID